MRERKIVGISGHARVGKNTFADCIEALFPESKFKIIALGDLLKEEAREQIYELYNLDSFSKKTEEKVIFRQFLVDLSKKNRRESLGKHYTNAILPVINECFEEGIIPIVADVRHDEYLEDEYSFIKNLGGIVVYVEKILKSPDGQFELLGPANQAEAENGPRIKEKADALVSWHEGISKESFLSKSYDQIADASSIIRKYLYDE
jgi:hypothetical protein